MAQENGWGVFPATIDSRRFGTLRLEEYRIRQRGVTLQILRSYHPPERLVIPSGRVALDPDGLELVIRVPDAGVPDVASFTATLEQQFDQFVNSLDRILDEAIPAIESAIADCWQMPDERAPTAEEIIGTGWLRQLTLNAGTRPHEIMIFDIGELIGGHDLFLALTADFHPISARFDG